MGRPFTECVQEPRRVGDGESGDLYSPKTQVIITEASASFEFVYQEIYRYFLIFKIFQDLKKGK